MKRPQDLVSSLKLPTHLQPGDLVVIRYLPNGNINKIAVEINGLLPGWKPNFDKIRRMPEVITLFISVEEPDGGLAAMVTTDGEFMLHPGCLTLEGYNCRFDDEINPEKF